MQSITGFENLNEHEQKTLIDVPVLVTFLVAGSDNNIDEHERDWAERLIEFRSMKNDSELVEYYNQVERSWEKVFQEFSSKVTEHTDPAVRSEFIAQELQKCNHILPKLDKKFASKLYESFKSFARQIAMASGGILGIGAISPAENKWVSLKMIQNPNE